MKRLRIDLNCDLGESFGSRIVGNDQQIMPLITSANIACGFHGGDPLTIVNTVRLALKWKVAIGAHPAYYDLEGFGRRPFILPPEELEALIIYQLGALKTICETEGSKMRFVKPHGALYNRAAVDWLTAEIILRAIKKVDAELVVVGLAGSKLLAAAEAEGIRFAAEAFADRAYNDDGTLVERKLSGAVIEEPQEMVRRALSIVENGQIETISGKLISLQADTICVHGDNQQAVQFAKLFRAELSRRDIDLKSFVVD